MSSTLLQTISHPLFGIYSIIIICLDVGWLVYCAVTCVKLISKYRVCKRKPNLHPIYRDVQFLSQQRKLYNLETHFVKNVLMFLCLSVELFILLWMLIKAEVNGKHDEKLSKDNSTRVAIEAGYPNCYIRSIILEIYFFPSTIFLHNIEILAFIFLFILLSILTRYLAARYLNHPFNRTFKRYIVWSSVQLIMVLFCSSLYTFIISFVLFPILLSINWFVLLKDSQFLSRVLKSNLREIELHTNNKPLFREQMSAYKFYCFFQKLMSSHFLF